ncbi:MAG TPA: 1-(5-phosphoribosyl)-5-amino-4-imidazole-carboxylate carboxylase, partial [Spirochaetota bacterium]|nr:1-(5-phosphoribosyl)-5-amino-4-imidazole-carboxylate carboxylase [Spirochaetota bacterium]
MDKDTILQLLREYRDGSVSEHEILTRIKNLPYEDIGYARIDHHRAMRWGFPEVIFCQGKTPEQV